MPSIRKSHISYHAYVLTMMPFHTISVWPLRVMDVIRGQKVAKSSYITSYYQLGQAFGHRKS